MKKILLTPVLAVLIFSACDQKRNDNSGTEEQIVNEHEDTESSIEEVSEDVLTHLEKIEEIDALCQQELNEARSLTWEKSYGEERQLLRSRTYLDDKGTIYKLVEEYSEPGYGDQGEIHFYFDNGKVFSIYHQYDSWKDSNYVEIHDEQIFLDENQEVIDARQKVALSIDEIESEEWRSFSTKEIPSTERAFAILKEEKPFKTHFLSYIQTDESLFLILGEPKEANEERFVTSVLANPNEPFIQSLIQNKESLKFKELEIDYFFDGGNGRPEFTILKSAKWVDSK